MRAYGQAQNVLTYLAAFLTIVMGMIPVINWFRPQMAQAAKTSRTPQMARDNLESSLSSVENRYRQGVETAEWQGPTTSDQSEDNYRSGIDEAISADRRRAGVRRVGDAGYKEGALGKGARNIVPGIRANLDKYLSNIGPSMARVEAVKRTLPPRTRDADANIDNRLKPIVRAQQGR